MSKNMSKKYTTNATKAIPVAILIEILIVVVFTIGCFDKGVFNWIEFLSLSAGPLLFYFVMVFVQSYTFSCNESYIQIYRKFFIQYPSNKIDIKSIKSLHFISCA